MVAISLVAAMALQGITLERRIVRAAPAGEDAAAYVAIASPAGEDRLIAVECACAERVEIHRVVRADGTASMRTEPALAVPAGGVEIRPGSPLHLMVMNLRAPLIPGQSVPMILRFERAGAVTASFTTVADSAAGWTAAQGAGAPALIPELQPLAFLAGSCWRGIFANRPGETDTHCFTPMLGGRFLRDVHVVAGAEAPYSGETVYRLDRDSGEIRFHYYSSEGFTSSGAARPTETGIDFPEESYRGVDGEMTVRSRWTRDGADAYQVVSESLLRDGTWEQAWRMRMVRVGPAPAPAR